MTSEQFTKSLLALSCWRETPEIDGADTMTAICFALRNRRDSGWENGTWEGVIEGLENRRGCPGIQPRAGKFPDQREPHWRKFVSRIDAIYDGTLADNLITPPAGIRAGRVMPGESLSSLVNRVRGLYWCQLSTISRGDRFLETVVRDTANHPKCGLVGSMTFYG